jgi:hypothetical protein
MIWGKHFYFIFALRAPYLLKERNTDEYCQFDSFVVIRISNDTVNRTEKKTIHEK